MLHLRAVATTVGLLFATGCNSLHDDLSRAYLVPAGDWLVEPGDLGLAAESFTIDAGSATLTGFFVHAADADGRTVLLFHDSTTNVSMLHPYCAFLVAAGMNVCMFDYRGFGHSEGEPSLRAVFYDMPLLLDWLHRRPDVDPRRIAYYGLAFGSVVALYTATRQHDCSALVVEDVPSPRDAIARRIEARGQLASSLSVGFAEFAGLPDGVEPAENAARLSMPSLWITGTEQPRDEVCATLRAYFEMRGDKQLWALPDTGHSPNSLLTFDGEYQRAVAGFLRTALDGAPEQVVASWRRVGSTSTGSGNYQIDLTRSKQGGLESNDDSKRAEPWAVQICALDAAGAPTWHKAWLEGARTSVRLQLTAEPGVVSAMQLGDVERTEAGLFTRDGTPLSRAGIWYESHLDEFDLVRSATADLEQARAAALAIHEREVVEPLPLPLEVELADVFAGIGSKLATSTDAANRAQALIWLKRALAATPQHPERHFWPGRKPTWGFPQAPAVARARATLRSLEGN